MRSALVNGRVLTPDGIRDDVTVIVEDGHIVELVSGGDAATKGASLKDAAAEDLRGQLLLPGFIDTQVNGGGGLLFNDSPDVATIRAIGAAHRQFGTTGFLPTLISDDLETIAVAIEAVRAGLEAGVPGLVGIHIEGPFLNSERRGVHDARHLRMLESRFVELLCSLHVGRTILTLAPEMTSPEVIAALTAGGVLVSAGHTNATFAEATVAIQHGLRGFTHLFNAMSPLTSREPGTVGAALYDANTWCGLIVDGHHVDPVTLRLALRCKRHDRFMLVTDAMPPVGSAEHSFVLQGRTIRVVDGVPRGEDGTIAGAALDMATAVRNCVRLLELDVTEAAQMASQYPAEFLSLGEQRGRIAVGYRADLVLMDEELRATRTWIGGASAG